MSDIRSVGDLVGIISAAIPPDHRIIVGIVGAPGAGKSTIAEQVVRQLGPAAVLLPMDGYHLPKTTLVELNRRDRMGAPDTFDVDGFLSTLTAVRRGFQSPGNGVTAPGFDRQIEEPKPDAVLISPLVRCVVVEGNYLLLDSGGWEGVAPLLDLTFFVELDNPARIERLVARHERYGKSVADARAWALGPDQINAALITATAARADYRIALG